MTQRYNRTPSNFAFKGEFLDLHFATLYTASESGTVPRRGQFGTVLPQTRNVSPQARIVPESYWLRATGAKFGSETSKIRNEDHFLVFIPESLELCAHFAKETFFLVCTLEFEENMYLCPSKITNAPPITLLWRRAWLECWIIYVCQIQILNMRCCTATFVNYCEAWCFFLHWL